MDSFSKYLYSQFYTSHGAMPDALFLSWPLRVQTNLPTQTELVKHWRMANGNLFELYVETMNVMGLSHTTYFLVHNHQAIYANDDLLDYEKACKIKQFRVELSEVLEEE